MRPPSGNRVLLIGPKAPPYGGMALQAGLLHRLLGRDGTPATLFPSNPPFAARWTFLERLRGLRPFLRSAVFTARLWRELPDSGVVHVLAASWLYFFFVVWPAVLAASLRGRRIVVNYRGGEASEFFRNWGWAARPVFTLADVVTVPSAFLADVISNTFHVPVQIVPNIVDLSVFGYCQRMALQPKILVTRHLERVYDIESVLRAFGEVQRKHPDASLAVAGSGSEEARLRDLAGTLRLRNVAFLGHVAHADLPALYKRCDILLNASRVDNFPGALMEASASGLAIVSTDAGGIPAIYRNGETALLVKPGDWQGLARGVERLLASPALAVSLTTAARVVAESCDWKQVRKKLYRAYGFPAAEDMSESTVSEDIAAVHPVAGEM